MATWLAWNLWIRNENEIVGTQMKSIHISIIPFGISLLLVISCFGSGIFPEPIFFYSATIVFLGGVIIGAFQKCTGREWFCVWTVFSFIFVLFSIDRLLLGGSIWIRFFEDHVEGYTDTIFPSNIPFRGLIPFIFFYFFMHIKKSKLNKDYLYLMIFTFIYCFYFILSPIYYTAPIFRIYYLKGYSEIKLINMSVLLTTILFAIIVLLIIKGFSRRKYYFSMSVFVLMFVTIHFFMFYIGIKAGKRMSMYSSENLLLISKLYFKYVWTFSGAVYMLFFMWYKSRRRFRRRVLGGRSQE